MKEIKVDKVYNYKKMWNELKGSILDELKYIEKHRDDFITDKYGDSMNNFYLGLIHKDQDILKKMAYIEVDNSLGKLINEKEGEDNG